MLHHARWDEPLVRECWVSKETLNVPDVGAGKASKLSGLKTSAIKRTQFAYINQHAWDKSVQTASCLFKKAWMSNIKGDGYVFFLPRASSRLVVSVMRFKTSVRKDQLCRCFGNITRALDVTCTSRSFETSRQFITSVLPTTISKLSPRKSPPWQPHSTSAPSRHFWCLMIIKNITYQAKPKIKLTTQEMYV